MFRQNARENLGSIRQIISLSEQDDTNMKILRNRLNREADKIDRMIIVDNLFAVEESDCSSNIAEKSRKMVDAISQGLVETLKRELKECRVITDNQKQRIKNMEKEEDEFLRNQLAAKNDGVKEMNELLEYLRKSIIQRKSDSGAEECEMPLLKNNLASIKNITVSLQNEIDKSYSKVLSKSEQISNMEDTIKDLQEQVKNYTNQIENLNEERDYFRAKSEQFENQYRVSTDETTSLQHRIRIIETERKTLFDENINLKSGKANIQDYCSNLSGENNKLVDRIKQLQHERDRTCNELNEYIDKCDQLNVDKNELENKYENLEQVILKLRHEYQDQSREINILSRENEDMKRTIQDNEKEKLKIRRTIKSVETGNRDLEDQIYQLTSELQKLRSEHSKVKISNDENNKLYEHLQEANKELEREKNELNRNIMLSNQETRDLNEEIKVLKAKNSNIDQSTSKRKLLGSLYEKVILKMLHQRKELVELFETNEPNVYSLKLCSTQSIDFKSTENIESEFQNLSDEIMQSFTSILTYINQNNNKLRSCDLVFRELSGYVSDFEDNDSCYGTENDTSEISAAANKLYCNKILKPKTPKLMQQDILKQEKKDNAASEVLMEKLKCLLLNYRNKSLECSNLNKQDKLSRKKLKCLSKKMNSQKRIEYNLKTRIALYKKELSLQNQSKQKNENENTNNNTDFDINDNELYKLPSERMNKREIIKLLNSTLKEIEIIINDKHRILEREKLDSRIEKIKTNILNIMNSPNDMCSCSKNEVKPPTQKENETEEKDDNELTQRFEVLQEQRKYMLDHLTFTNQRLEVLLEALKGKQTKQDKNNNEIFYDQPQVDTKRLFKRVKESFKFDQDAMKRAVSILELTKAISVTDLTELQENKAKDNEDLEMIVLVKNLNENMDSVLREARTKITDPKTTSDQNCHNPEELVPKSELVKKENELKSSLQKAQQKVEDLSTFLEKREEELKERDQIIEKLNKEYNQLKRKTSTSNDTSIQTRDRIIAEYRTAKEKLEEENEFLQHVVKELREELLKFQKSYRKEEENQKHLEEFVNELQISKQTLETSLDKMGYELNILKNDRQELLKTIQNISHPLKKTPNYGDPYNNHYSHTYQTNRVKDPVDYQSNGFTTDSCSTKKFYPNLKNNRNFHPVESHVSKIFTEPQPNYSQDGSYHYSLNNEHNNGNNSELGNTVIPYNHPFPHYGNEFSNQYSNGTNGGFQTPPCNCDECQINLYSEMSDTTTFPYSEEEVVCATSYDEWESLPSDQEAKFSSSESQATTSSSRIARNIKTVEASEAIRSKNRSQSYINTEHRNDRALISPQIDSRSRKSSSENADNISINTSITNGSVNSNRVRGRREQQRRSLRNVLPTDRRLSHGSSQSLRSKSPDHQIKRSQQNRLSFDSRRIYSTIEVNGFHQDNGNLSEPITNNERFRGQYNTSNNRMNKNLMDSPFLNTSYDSKKKKKKLFSFGKK